MGHVPSQNDSQASTTSVSPKKTLSSSSSLTSVPIEMEYYNLLQLTP